MKKLLLLLALLATRAYGQVTFPVNGPQHIVSEYFALTHITLFTDHQTRTENATLVVKDGKIVAAGAGIAIPKEARVIDLKGRYVYPAFIDLYSAYGVSLPQEKKSTNTFQQFLTSKNGAYDWNESIRAEMDAATLFVADDFKAKALREAGFGAVLTGLQDGICRGTSALVFTGSGKEHELIIREKAGAGFSFNKGTSNQDYPSSLMGSIALVRQTYYDARWYKTQDREKNLSLEAFNKLTELPAVFAVNDKLSVLRADKIAKEFGTTYIIKGAGDEYQRAEEIVALHVPLIIPVNFPKAYDVDDPFDAAYVSTADMKHWEMAPANAALLHQKQQAFAITMSGCENAGEFLKNLRKAVQYGLDEKVALQALTETPAKMIKAEKELGMLKKGMYANFIVCSGNLFDKETMLLETWSKGKKYLINESRELKVQGSYSVQLKGFEGYRLKIEGELNRPSASFTGKDTIKASYSEQGDLLHISFIPDKKTESIIRVNAWVAQKDTNVFPYQVKRLEGKAVLPDGTLEHFSALWVDSIRPNARNKADSTKAISYGEVVYPFTDFGWKTAPVQETVVFKNATVWSNEADGILKETDVAIRNGKIVAVGKGLSTKDAKVIDATGKHLTNGIIDEHSHIAITNGVNECTQAVTAEVRVGDVVYSEDINIYRQLAGGVTSAQLLHGSCNPIGGQSALIKLRWGALPEKMKIEGADGFIKFALGENVKQSNWDRITSRYPQTRMGVEQMMYDAFIRTKGYEEKMRSGPHTRKDLELDALSEVLHGKRFITCHSYVQSEINMLMHVADSMGFKVNTFTHILEGYKVADKMKKHPVNASTFADWWAYKYEVVEAIPYNAAIMQKVGLNVAINSDDAEMGRRLNQEAAKTIKYGNVSETDAWKMVTLNPAKMLHLDQRLGSVKAGKDADLVLWSDHPLSIYAKPEYTYVDGICYYSLEQDRQLQEATRRERQRLVQKLIQAKQNGEKTEKRVSREDENYHCED